MKRFSFHDGWQFREKVNPFAELSGTATPYRNVRLPHDAMIGGERSPDLEPATAYFPGGVYQYRKAFTLPPEAGQARVLLEFEGVYRHAMMYLNGALAGHHAYGYTGFAVDATGLIIPGENRLEVEARAHQDSRWYSGAGIYRPVWLWTGGPVHIALDGLVVTTPGVIVGTETAPTLIDQLWRLVRDNAHVIGDFTWTGWDYLGEVGVGRVQYLAEGERPTFEAAYPWITAWTGDLDITGARRPLSHYREIVFGLRAEPYIAVQRPEHHGKDGQRGMWSWTDSVGSWTWPGFEGRPVVVEVYSDADEVELLLNGDLVGRSPAGEAHRFRATFDLAYEPGTLEAIAYRDGARAQRARLATADGPLRLALAADRTEMPADGSDIAIVEVAITDASGTVAAGHDRRLTATVSGSGELAAFGSANPRTRESYLAGAHTTFGGRALAAIRATGTGDVTLKVSAADGLSAALVVTAR